MKAVDNGIPPKEVTKQVVINVIRDEYPPEFEGGPYVAPSVPENRPLGTSVIQVIGRDRDQKVCDRETQSTYRNVP